MKKDTDKKEINLKIIYKKRKSISVKNTDDMIKLFESLFKNTVN